MRSGPVVCPASLIAAYHAPRARMEIRGSSPKSRFWGIHLTGVRGVTGPRFARRGLFRVLEVVVAREPMRHRGLIAAGQPPPAPPAGAWAPAEPRVSFSGRPRRARRRATPVTWIPQNRANVLEGTGAVTGFLDPVSLTVCPYHLPTCSHSRRRRPGSCLLRRSAAARGSTRSSSSAPRRCAPSGWPAPRRPACAACAPAFEPATGPSCRAAPPSRLSPSRR